MGDAVLELLMSDYLFNNKKISEGEMTKLRAHYVCETALYEYSKRLELGKNLRLGKGEMESGGMTRKATNSDIFESFLGALYLDQGIEEARRFFKELVVPIIESKEVDFFDDYKSALQEYVQTDKRSLEYKLVDETGPAHNKTFSVVVMIDNIIYGKGCAHSKKEAEQMAAKNALDQRKQWLEEALKDLPHVCVQKPQGTFYSFADFGHYNPDSQALAQYLLEKALVAVVPGQAFGMDGHLRISFCASEDSIVEGVRRIKRALENLPIKEG